MSKKFYAGLLGVLAIASVGSFTSCTKDYGEDISSLQSQVSALQTTVNSLQSQINAGSVITNVASTTNGVTVTLSDGKTFTLTNGKDGADGKDGVNGTNGKDGANGTNGTNGKDGKDGSVVTIGTDGYWYIDGVKTDYPAQGPKGDKGDTGATGAAGKDGVDGEDGDTIYYYPNCEKNVWVKVTNGTEEETTNAVYVPGTVTAVWDSEAGTLTLNNVAGSTEPIVITASSALKSVALIPAKIYDGLGLIEFNTIYTNAGKYLTSVPATASYRLNPSAIDAAAYDWTMINRSVYTVEATKATGDTTNLVSIEKVDASEKGVAKVTLKLNAEPKELALESNNDIVALQATSKEDGEVVVSDYAYIKKTKVDGGFDIIHKDKLTKEKTCLDTIRAYRSTHVAITDPADSALYILKTPVLVYNQTLNLADYVETALGKKLATEYGLNPTYTYEFADEAGKTGASVAYLGDDKLTDQNKFVTLSKEGVMAVDADFVKNGRAAINRTPLVCVRSYEGSTLLDSAFIKVVVVDTTYVPVPPVVEPAKGWNILIKHAVNFCYDSLSSAPKVSCPDYTTDSLVVTWPEFNQKVLDNDAINMSLAEFRANYDITGIKIYEEVVKDAKKGTKDTVEVANKTLATGVDYTWTLPTVETTTTDILRETLINTVEPNSGKKYFYVYPAKDTIKNYDVVIEMDYTVNDHNHTWNPETFELTLNHDYVLGTQDKTVDSAKTTGAHPDHNKPLAGAVRIKGKSVNGTYQPISSIIEHFEGYEFTVPTGSTYTFEIVRAADKKNFKFQGTGATTDSTAVIAAGTYNAKNDPQVDILYTASEPLTSTVDVLIKITEKVAACGCTRATYYFVEFGAQFQLKIADAVLKTLKAQPDSVLVDSLITVTDGTAAVFEPKVADGKVTFVATQYGKDTYGFADGQVSITEYSIIYDKSGADAEVTFGGCLNKADTDLIVWDNMGTDLQNNKYAKLSVSVKIGTYYAAAGEDGKITVLSTENSK